MKKVWRAGLMGCAALLAFGLAWFEVPAHPHEALTSGGATALPLGQHRAPARFATGFPTARLNPATDTTAQVSVLAGRVMRANGQPAVGAQVVAIGTEAVTSTGRDGAFLLEVLPGDRRLIAQLDSEAGAMPSAATVAPGETVDGIVIRLSAVGSFEGDVNADDGRPIAGAQVSARLRAGRPGRWDRRLGEAVITGTSDATGHFTVGPLAPGIYNLEAVATGFTDKDEEQRALGPGQHLPVSFKLTRLGSIEGMVSDEAGRPLPDAIVSTLDWSAHDVEAHTTEDGRYRLEGVFPGKMDVRAGYADVLGHAETKLEIAPGQTAHADFKLPRAGRLAGTVRTASGGAVPTASIGLFSMTRYDLNNELQADGRGNFAASVLPGRYQVTASLGSSQAKAFVTVRSGAETELALQLVEAPARTEPHVTGLVVDATGNPVSGAWVGTRSVDSSGLVAYRSGLEFGSALTDEQGRFEVRPFFRRDGDSFAVVARDGSRFGSVQAVKAGADVVVTLQPGASIVGHVVGVAREPFMALAEPREPSGPAEASSWIRFEGDQFTLTDLAPVPSTIRVRQGDSGATIEVDLTPGETSEVDVRLSQAMPVTGRVIDGASGNAIESAYVGTSGESDTVQTQADGSFEIKLAAGPHTLQAVEMSYGIRELPIVVRGEPLDVGVLALARVAIRGGVGIRWDKEGSGDALIALVMPGGPAAAAGLQPGDVVTAVDGTPVESAAEASDLTQGNIGTGVTLAIRRGGTEFSSTMIRTDLDALIAKSK